MSVKINVVFWFYADGKFDHIAIDEVEEAEGIIHQLMAQNEGLA